jgi:hypothetical protein
MMNESCTETMIKSEVRLGGSTATNPGTATAIILSPELKHTVWKGKRELEAAWQVELCEGQNSHRNYAVKCIGTRATFPCSTRCAAVREADGSCASVHHEGDPSIGCPVNAGIVGQAQNVSL